MHAVAQAWELMGIAVPTMFGITILFICSTLALKKAFPHKKEEGEGQ